MSTAPSALHQGYPRSSSTPSPGGSARRVGAAETAVSSEQLLVADPAHPITIAAELSRAPPQPFIEPAGASFTGQREELCACEAALAGYNLERADQCCPSPCPPALRCHHEVGEHRWRCLSVGACRWGLRAIGRASCWERVCPYV